MIILSNLPGLNKAASIKSGRLVAAIIITSFSSSNPSISVRSWFTILSVDLEPSPYPLVVVIASISSKKIIVGDACLAFSKTFLIPFSDSPTHLEISSGPLTETKFASDSFATAFANKVLPVPGGP